MSCTSTKRIRRPASGYSLVELLVVLASLGILARMAMSVAEPRAERSRERELQRALWEIRDAIDAYHAARQCGAIRPVPGVDPAVEYPPNLDALTRVVEDQRPDHAGETLRFLRVVPRDPFSDATIPAAETWATLSYFDGVDDKARDVTARGTVTDVYDIHSKSKAIGLNGLPLARW